MSLIIPQGGNKKVRKIAQDVITRGIVASIKREVKTTKLSMKKKSKREKMSELTDRYKALGIPYPDTETMCEGQCEGTGIIPVKKNDPDERLRKLWEEAELEEPTDDGWHFVKCLDCNGTGIRKV